MQKHFSNRAHNFGSKLAGIRNNLKEKYGSQNEMIINSLIVEMINNGKVNVQDISQIYDDIDHKVQQRITNINNTPNDQLKKKKAKHRPKLQNLSFIEKPNEAIKQLKAFPAITHNNLNITEYAKTQRYQSFDKDRADKQNNSLKNRIMDRQK